MDAVGGARYSPTIDQATEKTRVNNLNPRSVEEI